MNPPPTSVTTAERPSRVVAWWPSTWAACFELTKPRLLSLVLVTTFLGYFLAGGTLAQWSRVVALVLGTALIGGGANGVNQVLEVDRDARMRRTRGRPLPSGRLTRKTALAFSLAASALGAGLLFAYVNVVTGALAVASWLIYIAAYTPLKPRTPLNTIVGAISGAIPPAMGWTAAAGRVEAGAAILFAILFIWQIPHFLSIAWIHRRDYEDGGFRMLPVLDPEGRATFRVVTLYSLGLLPVGWAAVFAGSAGWLYLVGSTLLGLGMVGTALRLHRTHTVEAARAVFLTSLAYLPGLFLLMLLDPTSLPGR